MAANALLIDTDILIDYIKGIQPACALLDASQFDFYYSSWIFGSCRELEMKILGLAKSAFDSHRKLYAVLICAFVLLTSCRQQPPQNSREITVAAASNLTDAFAELAKQFTARTGISVVYSFGSTADLAKQIENGGPFDVFASADVEHVDGLSQKGLILADTRAIYARGRLVLWAPPDAGVTINRLEDVTLAEVKTIAVAKPDLAPYGRATVEVLKALNVWTQVEAKVVYGPNVSITKQYATSGNANLAFIPLALVKKGEGQYIEVDERLHQPIDQALALIKSSAKQDLAREFVSYLLGNEGRSLLQRYGYSTPSTKE